MRVYCPYKAAVGVLVMACRVHVLYGSLSVCVYMYRSPGHNRFHRQPTPSQPGLIGMFLCAYSAGGFTLCMQIELVVGRQTL